MPIYANQHETRAARELSGAVAQLFAAAQALEQIATGYTSALQCQGEPRAEQYRRATIELSRLAQHRHNASENADAACQAADAFNAIDGAFPLMRHPRENALAAVQMADAVTAAYFIGDKLTDELFRLAHPTGLTSRKS